MGEEDAVALGIGVEARRGREERSDARARVSAARPDLVYYAGTTDRALPVLRSVAAAAPGATIMSTDALLLDRSFLRRAKPFESTLRLTASAQDPAQLPRARGQMFVRRYRERYRREPDPYAAYGYEAMALVLDLIDRAGDEAGDRTAIVDELFATSERDSVLGTYTIDDVGNTTLDRIAGYRVRDGRPVFDAALRPPYASAARRASSSFGWRNSNPRSRARRGIARCPPLTVSASSPPSSALSASFGAGTTAGRCSTRPRVRAKSRLVTGPGEAALIAPETRSSSSAHRRTPTSSSMWIQGRYWSPPAIGPPTPSLKGSRSCLSRPPRLSRTGQVRVTTTRRPAFSASVAAASHSAHSSASKLDPAGVSSSTIASPRS